MSDKNHFPETHWSLVLRAGQSSDPTHVEHLDQLLRRYWRPTFAYLRAIRPLSSQDAEDLTQGFFAMLLSRASLSTLDPDRGSFRGYLKLALRRFLMTHERAASRHPEHAVAAGGDLPDDAQVPSAEEAFDRAWIREVVEGAVARVRADLEARGKGVYMTVFDECCLGTEAASYEQVARRHGLKADDVRNYLRAVRKRIREAVRSEVRRYLLPLEDEEQELRFLLR